MTSSDDKSVAIHSSFGMISCSRGSNVSRVDGQWQTGGKRLFGSPLDDHPTTITVTIKQGERSHYLGRDRFYGSDTLVEIEMSPNQFAQFMTTMNVAEGVPCTIKFRKDIGFVEDPPIELSERERVREKFHADTHKFAASLKPFLAEANKRLGRKTMTTAERLDLNKKIGRLVQYIEDNIPFVLKSFDEASERIATATKAELDAFILTAVATLGFESLNQMKLALSTRETSEDKSLLDVNDADGK